MEKQLILSLKKINKSFGGIHALKGVDFELKKGEVHALIGENGAGKSTLIKILTGVYKPDSGEIILNGSKITVNNPIDARKKGIAAIYQELSLIESLTVAENIFLGNEPTLTPLGICNRKKIISDSEAYLNKFGINIDCRKLVSDLGMGQKRVIEIVKALVTNAEILLLDEPTTGMSKAEIDTLFEIIRSLKDKNVTMIYISHYLDEVFCVCDRSTVFRDGSNVATYEMNNVTMNELVRSMIGKEISFRGTHEIKSFDGKNVVLKLDEFQSELMKQPISFDLRESEILGITGIVGAGKSELALSIFGNAKKISGKMFIHGKEVNFHSPHDTKGCKIAFVPEDRKSQGLFLDDTVADNMVIVNIEEIQSGLKLLDNKKKTKISTEMGAKLRIQPLKVEIPARDLSGGNQQKAVLGKWLLGNPDIVILDDPTRGIDVGAKAEIHQLINGLAEQNKGIIVLSSEFDELISLCDRLIILYKGKIAGELLTKQATTEKLLSLSLGG